MADLFRDIFNLFGPNKETDPRPEYEIAVILWLKRDEGIATVVLRLAQALGKSVPLERQAFSVGVGEDKPERPTVALPNWKDVFERTEIKERSDLNAIKLS